MIPEAGVAAELFGSDDFQIKVVQVSDTNLIVDVLVFVCQVSVFSVRISGNRHLTLQVDEKFVIVEISQTFQSVV